MAKQEAARAGGCRASGLVQIQTFAPVAGTEQAPAA
jgi:hypothetical protein